MMPNPHKIFRAIDVLFEEFGEDIDAYVNMDGLLCSKSVICELRAAAERRIADTFLPGFTFEDDQHAAWFLKNFYPWRQLSFTGEVPPERYQEAWARKIFVPNRRHYIAEVAAAMQRQDQYTEETIRSYNEIKKRGDKKEIARASQFILLLRGGRALPPGPVKGIRDRMAMKSWHERLAECFMEFETPQEATSIARLARSAQAFRKKRERVCRNGTWQIKNLVFFGNINNPEAKDKAKWEEITHDYFEHWEWQPSGDLEAPKRTKISFREPASPLFWKRKWKKNKMSFRD